MDYSDIYVGHGVHGASLPIPGREAEMTLNNAGGMSFTVSTFERLRRFLVIGSDAGTYYIDAKALTIQNALSVINALKEDGPRVVREVVEISESGRAPKNDSALFVLAMAAAWGSRFGMEVKGDNAILNLLRAGSENYKETRHQVFLALPIVARTGTHLLQFMDYLNSMKSASGRYARKLVENWLNSMNPSSLAFQAVKYRQRNGWTFRDVLRLAHAKAESENRTALYDWIAHAHVEIGDKARKHVLRPESAIIEDAGNRFSIIKGYERARLLENEGNAGDMVRLIGDYNLPREAIPTRFLSDRVVLEALLHNNMPMTAMIRNLTNLSKAGVFDGHKNVELVLSRLSDIDYLERGRIHPINVLAAANTYATGRGVLSSSEWVPNADIVAALNAAFYKTFKNVQPTSQRYMLGVGVSDSMSSTTTSLSLSSVQVAAAMAMVTVETEPFCFTGGFQDKFTPLNELFVKGANLQNISREIYAMTFSNTDAASMVGYALENNIVADTFVLYTDNEHWHSQEHVTTLLEKYRHKTGTNAKLIAVGLAATKFSVVDPKDPRQLSIVGFDSATPEIISEFSRG